MVEEILVGPETLIEGLQGVVRGYAAQQCPFTLVMLIPTEPSATDTKYTLVISASWLDNMSPRQAVNEILDSLIRQIGSSESPEFEKVARVTVIKTKDPFVRTITSVFEVSNDRVMVENCEFNGVLIERAIVLESHRISAPVTTRQAHRGYRSKSAKNNNP